MGRLTGATPAVTSGAASLTGTVPWWVPLVIVAGQVVFGPPARAWGRLWDGIGEAAELRGRSAVLARLPRRRNAYRDRERR